jgi:hypothetical protein
MGQYLYQAKVWTYVWMDVGCWNSVSVMSEARLPLSIVSLLSPFSWITESFIVSLFFFLFVGMNLETV